MNIDSRNDGPASPGAKPLGPDYELESSSRAVALNPGESLTHVHTTIHFQAEDGFGLDEGARKIFGVSVVEIENAFKKGLALRSKARLYLPKAKGDARANFP